MQQQPPLLPAATTEAAEKTAEAAGSVYYLNFKPEVDEVWQKLAKEYTEETGVPVKVVTAASGTYEQTLMSEIANKEAPTLFQINGPIGYQNWKDYCADLKDTDLYSWLMDKSLAITGEDGGVYGIPYVVEGYGIIYNDAIMQKYFALDGAKAASMDEINNFAKLKEVVEDMQAKKDELGIEGVFASTSLTPGEDGRLIWLTSLYTTSSRTRVSPIPTLWSSLTPITSRTFLICTSTTPAQHPVCWEASL